MHIPNLWGVVIFKILNLLDLPSLGKIETKKQDFLHKQGRLRSMHLQVDVKSNMTISRIKRIQGPCHRFLNPMWLCLVHLSDLLFFCCFPCKFQGLHKTGIQLNSVSYTEYQLNLNTFPSQEMYDTVSHALIINV